MGSYPPFYIGFIIITTNGSCHHPMACSTRQQILLSEDADKNEWVLTTPLGMRRTTQILKGEVAGAEQTPAPVALVGQHILLRLPRVSCSSPVYIIGMRWKSITITYIYFSCVNVLFSSGYFTGLLPSSFMVGRAISAYAWGVVADRYGRRPVILSSLGATGVLAVAFGFSTTFTWALVCRCVEPDRPRGAFQVPKRRHFDSF